MKALKELGARVFFRISLFSAFFALILLVLLCLAAVQVEEELNVLAQVFPVVDLESLKQKALKGGGSASPLNGGGRQERYSVVLREFSQLKTLTPMEELDRKKIEEMFARYYLALRYEQVPDSNEMAYRWGKGGPLYLLSYPSVYNKFAGDLKDKIEALPNLVSVVEIKEMRRTAAGNGFTVIFRIHETLSDGRQRTLEKQASLNFGYISARRRYSPIFVNPYGLIFTSFEESDVKSASD